MSTAATEHITEMKQLPQAQYSLTDQLNELYAAAVTLGLYDAADFLTPHSPRTPRPEIHTPCTEFTCTSPACNCGDR